MMREPLRNAVAGNGKEESRRERDPTADELYELRVRRDMRLLRPHDLSLLASCPVPHMHCHAPGVQGGYALRLQGEGGFLLLIEDLDERER